MFLITKYPEMKYTVITTFHDVGLKQYAQKMIHSFEQNWPAQVDFIAFAENCTPEVTRSNTRVVDLLDASVELRDFVHRHRNNPLAHGRAGPPEVFNPRKQFRWDAVRFCYKVFAVATAEKMTSDGWLIWLDADSHTHSPVPMSALETLCPADSIMSYLGRGEKYHSECGWVAYNLNDPATRSFIRDFVGMYTSDAIFQEREWHDSYIWDVLRKRYQDSHRFHNLNPASDGKGLAGHPFINSELGRYMDHVKGDRKTLGHSKAKEVIMHKDQPYWQRVMQQGKVKFK